MRLFQLLFANEISVLFSASSSADHLSKTLSLFCGSKIAVSEVHAIENTVLTQSSAVNVGRAQWQLQWLLVDQSEIPQSLISGEVR
jgi:hypothetical protein